MGAGMWGTTFAQVLCDAGTPVRLWGRLPDLVATINSRHENPDYLPGITLPAELTASAEAAQVLDGADLVVLAVPAQTLRHHLGAWRDLLPPGAAFVSLMKGIELGTRERMSQVIADVTGRARTGSRSSAGRTWPGRSPSASTPPPSSPARTTRWPSGSSMTATPRTSGPTPTRT